MNMREKMARALCYRNGHADGRAGHEPESSAIFRHIAEDLGFGSPELKGLEQTESSVKLGVSSNATDEA